MVPLHVQVIKKKKDSSFCFLCYDSPPLAILNFTSERLQKRNSTSLVKRRCNSLQHGLVLTNSKKFCTRSQIQWDFLKKHSRLSHGNPNNTSCVLSADPSWSPEINTVKECDYNSMQPAKRWVLLWGLLDTHHFPVDLWRSLRLLRVKGNWKNHLRGDCCVYKWQLGVRRQLVLSFLLWISKACGCVVLSGFIPTEDSSFWWTLLQGHGTCKTQLSMTISIILCICRLTQGSIVTLLCGTGTVLKSSVNKSNICGFSRSGNIDWPWKHQK